MKPHIYRISLFLVSFFVFSNFTSAQQKLRTSERPYQQEFAKARAMQQQRNALINKMKNRNPHNNASHLSQQRVALQQKNISTRTIPQIAPFNNRSAPKQK